MVQGIILKHSEVTMSKLYTEEQVMKLLTNKDYPYMESEELIKTITPIELPTDEEITHQGLFDYASQFGEHCDPAGYNDKQVDRWNGFYDGAWWVLNKIKGGGE